MATFIGRNVGRIVWTGMDYKNGIALDPSLVMGIYPVTSRKTDVMVGITVFSEANCGIACGNPARLTPDHLNPLKARLIRI
ncbi:uncharacterized protein Dvar_55980 [Desulfosarcina variabilis str. Montpellier]